jgi:hypothetical protein
MHQVRTARCDARGQYVTFVMKMAEMGPDQVGMMAAAMVERASLAGRLLTWVPVLVALLLAIPVGVAATSVMLELRMAVRLLLASDS